MNRENSPMNYKTLALAVLSIALGGCVPILPIHTPDAPMQSRTTPDASLDYWVEKVLSPYLVKKLSQHPRFRNRTIVLATLNGDNMAPQTDGLVAYIQNQVKDALLAAPNVKLAWQPSNKGHFSPQHLAELDCADGNTKPIVIGIESRPSHVQQQTHIRVRALDPEENIWIPGLALKWEGRLSPNYVALMKQQQPEPYLQGLRQHPFQSHQPDLVANYLAKNMSCLLRGRLFDGDLTINTHMNQDANPFVAEVAAHIDNYLTRFQEVTVTQKASQANLTLHYKFLEVKRNQGLYVLSATLLKDHTLALPGMETSVYVTLPKARPKPTNIEQIARTHRNQTTRPQSRHTTRPSTRQRAYPAQRNQYPPAHEFRGYDLEAVERKAFDYAMDYGPNKPRVAWYALAHHNQKPMKGYFKVIKNVYRYGNECRQYYEAIYSTDNREQGIACRDHNGQWTIH